MTSLVHLDTPCTGSRANQPCGAYDAWRSKSATWCKACGAKREHTAEEKKPDPLDDLPTLDGMSPVASYLYFQTGGKWKYEGWGASIPIDGKALTHERIRELNGGSMPGITSFGFEYTIVVIDPSSFPRMVLGVSNE